MLPELVAKLPGLDVLLLRGRPGWNCLGQQRRFQVKNPLAPRGRDRSFPTNSTFGR